MSQKRRSAAALLPETVRVPPPAQDPNKLVETLATHGIKLNKDETTIVRLAMHHHNVARKPHMLWNGWKLVAQALAIGHRRAVKLSGSREGRGYNQVMGPFLNATGLAFLNAGVRWSLRQIARHLDDVETWREGLPEHVRSRMHDPLSVWQHYSAPERKLKKQAEKRVDDDDDSEDDQPRLEGPSLLEQYNYLLELSKELKEELRWHKDLIAELEFDHPELRTELTKQRAAMRAKIEEAKGG